MIKLALIGYGKMGKMIESIINPAEFEIIGKYDINNPPVAYLQDKPDVAIEFSTPDSVIDNIKFLAENKINTVCGTTGWYDKIPEIKNVIEQSETGFIYASNFSVGVNLFFKIVTEGAKLFDKFPQYSVRIEEIHHTQKLDRPSGTAIRIAEYIINEMNRKESYVQDSPDPVGNEINIITRRIENVVGSHKVLFDSEADSINLSHNAKSRRGFAEGALLAAKFILNKKGFFKFEDIFANLI